MDLENITEEDAGKLARTLLKAPAKDLARLGLYLRNAEASEKELKRRLADEALALKLKGRR